MSAYHPGWAKARQGHWPLGCLVQTWEIIGFPGWLKNDRQILAYSIGAKPLLCRMKFGLCEIVNNMCSASLYEP